MSSMSSTDTLYLIYLSTGFTIGFGHCIGMCGPIVISLSLNIGQKNPLIAHLLYNCGRIVTYSLIGGLMGATGSFTVVTANLAGLQKLVLIFAGILIVVMGLAMGGWLPAGRVFGDSAGMAKFIARGFKKLSARRTTLAYLPLGLLLGLLPCGPVYTALIGAARAGMEAPSAFEGVIAGMGLMLAFGIGTLPAMVLVGRLASMRWLKSRWIIYKTGAVLMILMGIYFIAKAIRY